MAQRVQVQLLDDLTGDEAQETVHFALGGTKYEIDLTTANADKLRSILSKYVENGRKATGRTVKDRPKPASAGQSSREGTQRIRQWARENGYSPSTRGRITRSIVEAYNSATKQPQPK